MIEEYRFVYGSAGKKVGSLIFVSKERLALSQNISFESALEHSINI